MNKEIEEYINRLKLEDVIWYIYIVLVILNLISNKYEARYVICNKLEDRNTFRTINIFVFTVALFIYAFFLIRNLKYNSNRNNDKTRWKINDLSLISSVIFLICGIVNLYIEIEGFNQEMEI